MPHIQTINTSFTLIGPLIPPHEIVHDDFQARMLNHFENLYFATVPLPPRVHPTCCLLWESKSLSLWPAHPLYPIFSTLNRCRPDRMVLKGSIPAPGTPPHHTFRGLHVEFWNNSTTAATAAAGSDLELCMQRIVAVLEEFRPTTEFFTVQVFAVELEVLGVDLSAVENRAAIWEWWKATADLSEERWETGSVA